MTSPVRARAAHSLGKIGTGNEIAIAALVQLLESTTVDDDNLLPKQKQTLTIKLFSSPQLVRSSTTQVVWFRMLIRCYRKLVCSSTTQLVSFRTLVRCYRKLVCSFRTQLVSFRTFVCSFRTLMFSSPQLKQSLSINLFRSERLSIYSNAYALINNA